jgi:lipoprotein NlpI
MLRPSSLSDEKLAKLKELEALGVKAAENGDFSKAISYFDTALSFSDTYSSAYNNRYVKLNY